MVTTAAQTTADAAEEAATSTLQKLRDQTDAVVQRVRPQLDAVSDYARDEPTKALLISAATGAALMGLVALLSRSSSRSGQARGAVMSTMATIRDAALDLADRAHSAANDALAMTQSAAAQAKKLAETTQKRAQDGADTVSDTMSDAWKSLREQAAPVVEKYRPQIDAVTQFAKDDPARTALGVAAAGAVLVGLLAMIRGSGSDSE